MTTSTQVTEIVVNEGRAGCGGQPIIKHEAVAPDGRVGPWLRVYCPVCGSDLYTILL